VKPSRVEPGQVWVLEEVGLPEHPLPQPVFQGAYLVTRVSVLESQRRRHALGEPYTTQAFGVALDQPWASDDELEPDGSVCIDYPDLMLHAGERAHDDSSHRWRFVA